VRIIIALMWLAAGPGGAALQATFACHHGATSHRSSHQRPRSHEIPTGPCFCDQMTNGFDLALSQTLHPRVITAPVWRAAIVTVQDPVPSGLPLTSSPTPPTPPPNRFVG
jgi:hypothetical protein